MIRSIAAARTTLVVTAWLLGGPTILAVVAGSPVPAGPPSAGQVQAWLQDPLDPAFTDETARVAAWTLWALITIAVLAALARQLRTAQWAKIISYLPAPAQSLAAAILGTAVVATCTSPLITPPAAAATASDLQALDAPLNPPPATAGARTATATITPPTASPGARHAAHGVHRVVEGDSLWDIADRHLDDPYRWRDIYRLNRGHVQADGYALTDPDEIDVGWVLALPARHPTAQPSLPPVTTPPVTRQPSPPTTQTPSPSASPRTQQAAPSASAAQTARTCSDDGDGVNTPPSRSPGTTAPPSTPLSSSGAARPSGSISASSPAAGEDAEEDAETASTSSVDGIDVPGGWITLGLGSGLVAAVTMVWRRRRHRYRPTPISSPRLNDPNLVPPLAAMTRIRTNLRRTAPETLDQQPAQAPTVREYRAAVVKPELPPVGPTGSELAGTAALALSPGLGLTGDGALDAARGLLVATLASGSGHDPDATGRAIITADTLVTLLGASAADLGHLDRLTVTASEADAITALEEEIIRRSRLIADMQAADVHTLRDNDVHAEPLPQLLLIAEVPDPARAHRLATAVRLGHRVDIGATMIGDWPTGTTLTVAADGTTGNDDAPRLAVLDTAAAIEILGVLRQAHGDIDSPARPEPSERPNPPASTPAEPRTVVERDTECVDDVPAPATVSRLPVAVRILGRPAVLHQDGHPSSGIRSKAIELLVYLAVNRHGADLSDIMEALYPDANMRRARERLSTVVADLRKHIRQAAAPADTEPTRQQRVEPVPNTGSRYHLDPDIVRVDWWTVLDHYEAVATTTDTDQQLAHLTAAIDATGGALAEGVDYDWIDTDREVVRRHRIKLHAHAAALLADTDPHQSWLLLEQACQIDPLSDEVARTTMRAAAALGDADAIRHRHKTLREALDAHGLDLSDETDALAHELLHQLHPTPPSE